MVTQHIPLDRVLLPPNRILQARTVSRQPTRKPHQRLMRLDPRVVHAVRLRMMEPTELRRDLELLQSGEVLRKHPGVLPD